MIWNLIFAAIIIWLIRQKAMSKTGVIAASCLIIAGWADPGLSYFAPDHLDFLEQPSVLQRCLYFFTLLEFLFYSSS